MLVRPRVLTPTPSGADIGRVKYSSNWRQQRPGVWLGAGLVASLLTYASATDRVSGTPLWVALDLWLAHRIWKRGATALAWFRGLQTFGLVLFATAVVLARWQDNVGTGATVGTVLLYALSLWSLTAPALSDHVAPPPGAIPDMLEEGEQSGRRN